MQVLVTGGTGRLGRLVVTELVTRGHSVRVLSRRAARDPVSRPDVVTVPGDLVSGEGLAAAVEGVETVVDAVNAGRRAGEVMVGGTRRLVEAAGRAGVGHVVGIGIVGAESIAPLVPYYRVKVAQERVLADGPVPWSWLAATQFHDFIAQMVAALARPPVLVAPAVRYQPVDRSEVAAALVDAAEAGPAGRLPDLAGPRTAPLVELARGWLAAHHRDRRTVTVPIPGRVGRRLREGSLCNPDRAVGRSTFEEWVTRAAAPLGGSREGSRGNGERTAPRGQAEA